MEALYLTGRRVIKIIYKKAGKFYKIICDYCGEVILDTEEGIESEGFVKMRDKYYHIDCFDKLRRGV